MIVLAALLAIAATAPEPAKAAPSVNEGETVRYVVKRRDTLYDFSRAFIVTPRTWRALLPLSRVRDPHRLPIGRTLAIPRAWLRFTPETAALASFRGTVTVSAGGRDTPPAIGMTIGEGARITTGANSFATLILADRSRISLPSQSDVTVRRLERMVLTGAVDYQLDLGRGRLQTVVTPLTDPSGRYRIGTPLTMTAVRGTEFRVAYEPAGTTAATEVLGGTVAVAAAVGRLGALVPKGSGAIADAQGAIRTEPLLPAPDLVDPGQVQREDQVAFHVAPVDGAAGYHLQFATDAGFVDAFAEATAPGRDFSLPDVPNGNQFVRVSAIAPGGLEGISQAYAFKRRLGSIHAGAATADADGYRFRWFGAGAGVRRYHFQMMGGAPAGTPIVDEVGLTRSETMIRRLGDGVYYWRVALTQPGDDAADGEIWSDFEKLTIGTPRGG